MRIAVQHVTHYTYGSPLDYVIQRLLLSPQNFAAQRVISWKIQAPGIEGALEYFDAFGNRVHLVSAQKLKDLQTITASGVVEVDDAAGVVQGLANRVPDNVFLRQTMATTPSEPMLAMLDGLPGRKGVELNLLHELMAATHDAITYETGSTHAHTAGADAFDQGRGVCQDHAHVFVGLARAAGIPARYVTGYLVSGAISPAAHAWAEALVPNLGWIGFDAANGKCPTDHYVRIACGLDAPGTALVRGCRRGGLDERMTVEVRAEMAQQ
jgi:transglutaminase-like putative cysteine protease